MYGVHKISADVSHYGYTGRHRRKEEKMERIKNILARGWNGFRRTVCSRVFAAVLMCVVTMSMVMGATSHSYVYTVNDNGISRVVITMSDAPYLSLDGNDVIWVNTDLQEDPSTTVEIQADGMSTLVNLTDPDTTVADALYQAGITVGEHDQISEDASSIVTDGMLVEVDRVEYEEYTVTETIPYQTKYHYTCVLKTGATKQDRAGRNGEKQITYRKSIVNGEVVSVDVVDEEITKQPVNRVLLKGSAYGTPISKAPSDFKIRLDENNQPLEYARLITGQCTAYHGDTATSTGRKPGVGVVAVDPREIPYGSILWIVSPKGGIVYGYAIAGDTGGFIHNSETVVDLYMDSVVEMNTFGRRQMNVYVIKEGSGR